MFESLVHGPHVFKLDRSNWPSLEDAYCAYAFARAFHYDDLRASAKWWLLEAVNHTPDLEESLARVELGSLGASVDSQMVVSLLCLVLAPTLR